MARPIVAVLRQIPQVGLDALHQQAGFDVRVWKHDGPPHPDDLRDFVRGATAIVPTVDDTIDARAMNAAGPQLRVVACYSVGHNNVDKEEAGKRGIRVTNTPNLLTDATADLTMAVMLSLVRHIVPAAEFVKEDRWHGWMPLGFRGIGMRRKTVGIVGFGAIGQAVAHRLLGFGVKVIFFDPYFDPANMPLTMTAKSVDFDAILEESDIITLHCDLNDGTRHIIDWAAFTRMAKSPYLINCARGGLVSTEALVEALRVGHISGAGLDVTDPEPLPADHPLLDFENVLVVPHIGSATYEARDDMSWNVADSIITCVNSNEIPPNCVNAKLIAAQ